MHATMTKITYFNLTACLALAALALQVDDITLIGALVKAPSGIVIWGGGILHIWLSNSYVSVIFILTNIRLFAGTTSEYHGW